MASAEVQNFWRLSPARTYARKGFRWTSVNAQAGGQITGALAAPLRAQFDFVTYARPVVPASLAARDLTDPADVSDADLLAFLGV